MKPIINSVIFRRFIAIFFCAAIPFLCITLYFTWRAERFARAEMLASMRQKADYFAQSFEQERARVISQHESLMLDHDLTDLAFRGRLMSRFAWTMTVTRLQERLGMFKSTDPNINVMSIYVPPLSQVLSSPGSGRHIFSYLTDAERAKVEPMPGGARLMDNQLNVYTVSKRGDTVYYAIETVMSWSRLISEFKHLSGSASCFLYNEGGVISEPQDAKPARELSAKLSRSPGEETAVIDGRKYIAVKRQLSAAGLLFVSFYDESSLAALTGQRKFWLWSAIALFFGLTCFYAFMTHRYMNQPVLVLLDHFTRLESGDLDTKIDSPHHDEFGILFNRFNQMVDRLNSVILQSYKQTIYLQRAELKQLQAQINPHFLYNTYFMLHRMIKSGDPLAAEFSGLLGEYFRYITKSSEDMAPFEREDAHARNYANIQALRFEGRVQVGFDPVPPEMQKFPVPQLILQPVLENAYLHGLENLDGGGVLKVSYTAGEDAFHVAVMNNGADVDEETLSAVEAGLAGAADLKEASGLANIHRRLQLAFGGGSGLKVSHQGDFFIVEMTINRYEKTADS